MGNSIRRAVMLRSGFAIGDELTKRRYQIDRIRKDPGSEAVIKALVGYYENLLRPKKGTTIWFKGELVWYTPPESKDGLDVEQGRLQAVKSGVARIKPHQGPERRVPVGNLEQSWQDKLRRMGVWK